MRVVVVGSGLIGSFTGVALARRGHSVVLVDRDAGPNADGSWTRKGVMQYDLPHGFRPQVREAIQAEMPELWSALLLAGGVPAQPPGLPPEATGLECRRSTFERTLWGFCDAEPGLRRAVGHADRLVIEGGRAAGVVVDGATITADLVVVATGRSSSLGDELRAPAEGGPCGFAYAARQYRARPGVELPNWGMPRRHIHDGYEAIVFAQDAGTLHALFVRPTADSELAAVREAAVFDALAAQVPLLAAWTDPDRFEPFTAVRAGSNLWNSYRGQRGVDGSVMPGVVFVGDAVCTTNPAFGRGVVLGMWQARQLLTVLDEHGDDLVAVARALDAWCAENIRPWFLDHVELDAWELRRFAGGDLDVDGHLPSDVICDCAAIDSSLFFPVIGYLGMLAPPNALDAVQDAARAVLRTGWRQSYAAGPTRDDLVASLAQPVG